MFHTLVFRKEELRILQSIPQDERTEAVNNLIDHLQKVVASLEALMVR